MLHVVKKQKMTRSGGKLPDLLKTERESCSPVIQRQLGSSDCGLMAIAFAASLCSGLDHHTLKYDQSKLRSDFLSCIESGCLLPFHIPGATRRFGRAKI